MRGMERRGTTQKPRTTNTSRCQRHARGAVTALSLSSTLDHHQRAHTNITAERSMIVDDARLWHWNRMISEGGRRIRPGASKATRAELGRRREFRSCDPDRFLVSGRGWMRTTALRSTSGREQERTRGGRKAACECVEESQKRNERKKKESEKEGGWARGRQEGRDRKGTRRERRVMVRGVCGVRRRRIKASLRAPPSHSWCVTCVLRFRS